MYKEFGINSEIIGISDKVESEIQGVFRKIDKTNEFNSLKVLKAFQKYNLSDMHFGSTTGYGYGDIRKRCNWKNI